MLATTTTTTTTTRRTAKLSVRLACCFIFTAVSATLSGAALTGTRRQFEQAVSFSFGLVAATLSTNAGHQYTMSYAVLDADEHGGSGRTAAAMHVSLALVVVSVVLAALQLVVVAVLGVRALVTDRPFAVAWADAVVVVAAAHWLAGGAAWCTAHAALAHMALRVEHALPGEQSSSSLLLVANVAALLALSFAVVGDGRASFSPRRLAAALARTVTCTSADGGDGRVMCGVVRDHNSDDDFINDVGVIGNSARARRRVEFVD